ncbi:MAG: SIR2 family protein [Acidobacteriaceae bacterium]|nr:SIR2 family protein [Acidobacteriaceae bacterium]MBV9443077.1 SIR2 family protein [Acidobacteriaceae bacterium]
MSGHKDPWPEYCRRLNKHYRQGNLRILVGAGPSIDSNFPSWGELNRGLLLRYVQEDLGRDAKAKPIIHDHVRQLVEELYETIGREAAADFVWNSSTRENFFEDLRVLLYRGRNYSELPLQPVHRQLAAMDNAAIFTTNFDPLLELAKYHLNGGTGTDPDLTPLRAANPPQRGTSPDKNRVYHVHGWIDPDGICGGSFVLTESQYFELFSRQAQRPNQMLEYALTSGGAVLILGMSLADVNLRRHLYLRSRNRVSDSTEIYAVLQGHGRELLETYQTLHWASRGVRLIYLQTYGEIPRMLREVKFGLAESASGPLPWMNQTVAWVHAQAPAETVFSDRWQSRARNALQQMLANLRDSFAIPQQEVVHATLFGPVSLNEIATFCDSRHTFSGKDARAYANQFRLKISGGKPQGVAGVAFSLGEVYQVRDNPDVADQNFTPEMKRFYASKGLRNWRSLIAIPIFRTEDYLPVLVMTFSSNLADPFWTRFGEKSGEYSRQLASVVDLIVQEILSLPIKTSKKAIQ